MKEANGINKNTSLFLLTWPIFIELVLQMLVGNVDQFMISQFSEKSVAAIGNVNQIMNFLTITFSVITMATTILVSQFLDSKNKEKLSEIYTAGMFINVVFSLAIGMLLLLGSETIFTLLRMPEELMQDAVTYIHITGGLIFLQAIFMNFSAIFRSNGLMKQGMYVSIVVNTLNIVGNAILLNGYLGFPALGIKGIAISSVFSRFIGVVIIGFLFVKKIEGEISFKYLRPFPKVTCKKLLTIGLPAGGENVAYNISQMLILLFVNMMGTTVITARVYVNMMAWFSFLYSSAVAQANQIIVGHLVGAKDEEGAYERTICTLKPALVITLIVSITMYFFSEPIFGIFTSNPEILKLVKSIMLVEIFLEIGRAVNLVVIRGMQAAGDIKYPVVIGVLSTWLVATLFSYILGIQLGFGLVGVWMAMAADELLRAAICGVRWKKGGWRNKGVTY